MPRRSARNIEVKFEINEPLVSPYLANTYFEMAKTLKRDMECPVCLESLMCCKDCFCLLKCGHSIHAKCYFYIQDKSRCPVCRAE